MLVLWGGSPALFFAFRISVETEKINDITTPLTLQHKDQAQLPGTNSQIVNERSPSALGRGDLNRHLGLALAASVQNLLTLARFLQRINYEKVPMPL